MLYVPYNTEEISLAYESEYSNERENQVILLMITNNKKCYYLVLKSERIFYNEKWCNRPKKICLDYLGQKHRIITEIFTV